MAITLLLPVHSWAADPPISQNVASCGAACQASAPMTVDSGVMDVNFNYTASVEVIAGVMSEDFSAVWWLTDSCTLSTGYAQAASNAGQFLCNDVPLPAGSEQGWVFWLVAPTATADFGNNEWWNSGVYELMWYQMAGGSASVDPDVMSEFNDLETFIAMTPDQLLIKELEDAKSAYEGGQPCTAANSLGDFLDHANDLISGNEVASAEELRNRGWMLQHNLLASLPQGCPGFEDVGAAAELTIRQSSNEKFGSSVDFGRPLMQTVQAAGQVWTQVAIPSLQSLIGEPGMPGIPTWQTLVAVPMGADVHLNITSPKVGEEIPLHLYPFQEQAFDDELTPFDDEFADPPFKINESAYAQKGFYPADPCSIAIVGQVRDLAIAQLTCSAGQYNPDTQSMRFFDSVDVEVVFEGGNGAFITSQSLSPFEKSSQVGIAAVANREAVLSHVLAKDYGKFLYFGEELLILTHPDFRDAAEDLAEWKREKGISTTILEVGAGTIYDEGDEIDDLIEWRYENCTVRLSYVLLLGDAEFVPPARLDAVTGSDSTTGSDYGYTMYPHFFFDIFPDFGVARISVDTAAEAQLVVDKIIQYESDPPFVDHFSGAPFYTTAAFASQFQCCRMYQDGSPLNNQPGTTQRGFIETSELVRNHLRGMGYTVERIYTETVDLGGYCLDNLSPCTRQQPYNGDTTPNRYYNGTLLPTDLRSGSGFPWNGSTADIIDAFNDGRFLILHRDHGGSGGFSHPSFTTWDLGSLTNDELLPVVYSVNCASGYFDRETDTGGTTESFMERLLLVDDGGMVGGLGDNRNSPTWANNALTRGFFDATWTGLAPEFGIGGDDSCRRLGDILNHGKIYLLSQVGVTQTAGSVSLDQVFSEWNMWHAFGDPTLEMWTSNPHKFLLVKNVNFEVLKDRLVVKYPIAGAVITALQETDDGTVPIGRATVEDGVAEILFFAEPVSGVPIRLSASFKNAVSVPRYHILGH